MEGILSVVILVVLGLVAVRLLLLPMRLLGKLAINSISGFICLWLLNLVSGITGIVFEINFFTALLVGFLGIPGIVLLVLKHFFL